MSDSVAVPRIDGLTDWYYLEGDQIRHVVKIGFRIKLERLFQYDSPDDAAEFFRARRQERSDLLRKWGETMNMIESIQFGCWAVAALCTLVALYLVLIKGEL